MSDIRQNLSDYVRDHPDAIVVAFAVIFLIVLTLAVVNFLWARRAALLRRELTAVRAAMTDFVAPTGPATGPSDSALVERDGRTMYSVASAARPAAAAGITDADPATRPATPAEPARWKTPGPAPASSASWALGMSDGGPHETESDGVLSESGPVAAPAPIVGWPAVEPEALPPPAIVGVDVEPDAEPHDGAVEPEPHNGAAEPEPEPVADSEPALAQAGPVVAEPEPTAAPADATSSYAVWHAVTAADEVETHDGSPPPVPEPAAASAYAAWGQVTTPEPTAVTHPDELLAGDMEPALDEPLRDYPELEAPPLAPLAPPAPAPWVAAEPEVAEPEIPAETTAVADEPTPPVDAAAEGDAGPDILLVEDDENVGKVYRLLMESKGYAVRHAVDGLAGLELARAQRPDLILLDVMMPRMNGILFLQSLRAEAHLRDVPVVILSNFREPRLVERALALGAIEYMVKAQTRPDAMLAAIPRWLRGERALTG